MVPARGSHDELETVFVGPPSEVYVAQSVLHNLGFLTYIANENIKTIDPFVTGLNPVDARGSACDDSCLRQSRLPARYISNWITYQKSVAREAKSAREAATWLPIR